MGVEYGWTKQGSITPSGSSLTDLVYLTLSTSRDPHTRRVKPLGVELLFNGTSMASYRTAETRQSYYKESRDVDGKWIGTAVSQVSGNVLPAPTGSGIPGYSTVYPTSDWGTQLAIKLKDSALDIAQAFAERKQTVNLFMDYSTRLIRAYRALRHGRPHDVYKALSGGKPLPKGWKRGFKTDITKELSDNWLAWQYGVRPLVQDIAGAVTEIYKVRSVQPLIRKVSFKLPHKGANGYLAQAGVNQQLFDHCILLLDGRVTCYAEFNSGASAWDQTAQRLGLTNPALLVWELIPYSFVIDWFIQVGDFLQATGQISGLKRVGIHVTSKYTQSSVRTQFGATSLYKSVTSKRIFYNSVPVATLNFGSGLSTSITRRLNALALIRSPMANLRSRR
jgi:hypothetical protein